MGGDPTAGGVRPDGRLPSWLTFARTATRRRRDRHRIRPQRPGRGQPARRPRVVGHCPRGAARAGRRGEASGEAPPRFHPDTFSAFYPLAARVAGDPGRWVSRSTACAGARSRRARPSAAGRRAGRCCTATSTSRPPASTPTHPGTARLADAVRAMGRSGATHRRADDAVPAGARRAGAARPAPPGRRPWLVGGCSRRPPRSAARGSAGRRRAALRRKRGPRGHPPRRCRVRGSWWLLMTMLGQTVGFPVPEGGAGRADQAWPAGSPTRAARSCATPRSSAWTSRTAGPRRAHRRANGGRARRAVVADVVAPNLFGRLSSRRRARPGSRAACSTSSSTRPRSRWTGRSAVRSRGRLRRRTPRHSPRRRLRRPDAEAPGQVRRAPYRPSPFLLSDR